MEKLSPNLKKLCLSTMALLMFVSTGTGIASNMTGANAKRRPTSVRKINNRKKITLVYAEYDANMANPEAQNQNVQGNQNNPNDNQNVDHINDTGAYVIKTKRVPIQKIAKSSNVFNNAWVNNKKDFNNLQNIVNNLNNQLVNDSDADAAKSKAEANSEITPANARKVNVNTNVDTSQLAQSGQQAKNNLMNNDVRKVTINAYYADFIQLAKKNHINVKKLTKANHNAKPTKLFKKGQQINVPLNVKHFSTRLNESMVTSSRYWDQFGPKLTKQIYKAMYHESNDRWNARAANGPYGFFQMKSYNFLRHNTLYGVHSMYNQVRSATRRANTSFGGWKGVVRHEARYHNW